MPANRQTISSALAASLRARAIATDSGGGGAPSEYPPHVFLLDARDVDLASDTWTARSGTAPVVLTQQNVSIDAPGTAGYEKWYCPNVGTSNAYVYQGVFSFDGSPSDDQYYATFDQSPDFVAFSILHRWRNGWIQYSFQGTFFHRDHQLNNTMGGGKAIDSFVATYNGYSSAEFRDSEVWLGDQQLMQADGVTPMQAQTIKYQDLISSWEDTAPFKMITFVAPTGTTKMFDYNQTRDRAYRQGYSGDVKAVMTFASRPGQTEITQLKEAWEAEWGLIL